MQNIFKLNLLSLLLLSLPFINFNFFPLVWVALAPFLISLNFLKPRYAFFTGWAYGCLFYIITLNWLFNIDLALPLIGIFFHGIGWGIFAFLALYFKKNQNKWHRLFYISSIFSLIEILRYQCPFGSTLGSLDVSQYKFLPILQILPLMGGIGLTFFIVMFNVYLAELIFHKNFSSNTRMKISYYLFTPLLILICLTYGIIRISSLKPSYLREELKVAIIQPSRQRWNLYKNKILNDLLEQSKGALLNQKSFERIDLLIWPEVALPGYVLKDTFLLNQISDFAIKNKIYLLTGALDTDENREKILNSSILFLSTGEAIDYYHKVRLIPYAEYIPFGGIVQPSRNLIENCKYSSGNKITIFEHPKCRFSTLICYESIFPQFVQKVVKKGAQLLITLSDDSRFKRSSEPEYHLALSILRAVENNRYLIYAANTGISAIVDPTGRILKKTEIFVKAQLMGEVYPIKDITFYTRFSYVVPIFCFLFIVLCVTLKR